jgi:hypothetical protein
MTVETNNILPGLPQELWGGKGRGGHRWTQEGEFFQKTRKLKYKRNREPLDFFPNPSISSNFQRLSGGRLRDKRNEGWVGVLEIVYILYGVVLFELHYFRCCGIRTYDRVFEFKL